jgi:hypothetical protein
VLLVFLIRVNQIVVRVRVVGSENFVRILSFAGMVEPEVESSGCATKGAGARRISVDHEPRRVRGYPVDERGEWLNLWETNSPKASSVSPFNPDDTFAASEPTCKLVPMTSNPSALSKSALNRSQNPLGNTSPKKVKSGFTHPPQV